MCCGVQANEEVSRLSKGPKDKDKSPAAKQSPASKDELSALRYVHTHVLLIYFSECSEFCEFWWQRNYFCMRFPLFFFSLSSVLFLVYFVLHFYWYFNVNFIITYLFHFFTFETLYYLSHNSESGSGSVVRNSQLRMRRSSKLLSTSLFKEPRSMIWQMNWTSWELKWGQRRIRNHQVRYVIYFLFLTILFNVYNRILIIFGINFNLFHWYNRIFVV